MRYGMDIDKLAELVADYFKEAMKEGGFETFKEMKDCYWWTAQDIRDEISYIAQTLINDEYEKDLEEYGGWENIPYTARCYVDDFGNVVEYESREVKYGQFKKMVMSHL